MGKAEDIFEKHWIKATGKPLDEATKHHLQYAIDAVEEALNYKEVVECRNCGERVVMISTGEMCPHCYC